MPEPDSLSSQTLAALADATDPRQLLPAPRRVDGSQVPSDLSLLEAMRLSAECRVGVFSDSAGRLVAAPFCIADTSLVRATPGDGAAASLARLLLEHDQLGVGGFALSSFTHLASAMVTPAAGERAMDVDQTHESVVVGDAAVVKWAVHAEPTPAPELIAHLSLAGFTEMPLPWGFLTWEDGQRAVLVASVAQYLPGASDGWTWAVLDAGDFAARGGSLAGSVEAFGLVGTVVADLHASLATPTEVMASPAQMVGADEVATWCRLAHLALDDAIASVDAREGDRLVDLSRPIGAAIDAMGDVSTTTAIPVHGDLHIGQVLRWDGGYAVGDFDGNPVLPVAQRLALQPAARDVAGLLQSIDHVGRVVLRRVGGADGGLVDQWIREAQSRFLDSYRVRLADRGSSHLLDDRLLRPFQVEQECREFLYAVRHLPSWRYVPDQAMQALFSRA